VTKFKNLFPVHQVAICMFFLWWQLQGHPTKMCWKSHLPVYLQDSVFNATCRDLLMKDVDAYMVTSIDGGKMHYEKEH